MVLLLFKQVCNQFLYRMVFIMCFYVFILWHILYSNSKGMAQYHFFIFDYYNNAIASNI